MAFLYKLKRKKYGCEIQGLLSQSEREILRPYILKESEEVVRLRGIWSLEALESLGVKASTSPGFVIETSRGYPGRIYRVDKSTKPNPRNSGRSNNKHTKQFIEIKVVQPYIVGQPLILTGRILSEPDKWWQKSFADMPQIDAYLIFLYQVGLWGVKTKQIKPEPLGVIIDHPLLVEILKNNVTANNRINERRRKRLINLIKLVTNAYPSVYYRDEQEVN